jgi:hypothetical protein
MSKIYISGKITGIEKKAPLIFEKAEIELIERGFEVINPMKIKHSHDGSWINYMKNDIKSLMDCDAIYMLSNWTGSKGAEIERRLALDLGMKIIYE